MVEYILFIVREFCAFGKQTVWNDPGSLSFIHAVSWWPVGGLCFALAVIGLFHIGSSACLLYRADCFRKLLRKEFRAQVWRGQTLRVVPEWHDMLLTSLRVFFRARKQSLGAPHTTWTSWPAFQTDCWHLGRFYLRCCIYCNRITALMDHYYFCQLGIFNQFDLWSCESGQQVCLGCVVCVFVVDVSVYVSESASGSARASVWETWVSARKYCCSVWQHC